MFACQAVCLDKRRHPGDITPIATQRRAGIAASVIGAGHSSGLLTLQSTWLEAGSRLSNPRGHANRAATAGGLVAGPHARLVPVTLPSLRNARASPGPNPPLLRTSCNHTARSSDCSFIRRNSAATPRRPLLSTTGNISRPVLVIVLSGDDLGYDAAYRWPREGGGPAFWGEGRDGARTACKSCFGVYETFLFVERDARSQAR